MASKRPRRRRLAELTEYERGLRVLQRAPMSDEDPADFWGPDWEQKLAESDAEIVPRRRDVWIEFQRLAIERKCRVRTTLLLQDVRFVGHQFRQGAANERVLRCDSKCAAQQLNRGGGVSRLRGNRRKQTQRVNVAGLMLEDLPVDLLRLREAAGLVMRKCKLQRCEDVHA